MSHLHPDLSVSVQGDSNPGRISFTVQRNSEGTLQFHIVNDDAVEDTIARPGGSEMAVAPSPMAEHGDRSHRRYLTFLNNAATSRIEENSDEEAMSPRATYALPTSQNNHSAASLVASPRPRGAAPYASVRGGLAGSSGTSSVEASPKTGGFHAHPPAGHPDMSMRLSPGEAAIAALRAASPRPAPSSSPAPVAPAVPAAPAAPAAPVAPVPPVAPVAPAAPLAPQPPQAPAAPPVPTPRNSHLAAPAGTVSGTATPTHPAHSRTPSAYGTAPGAPGSSLPAPPPPVRPSPGSVPSHSPPASTTSGGAATAAGAGGVSMAIPPAGSVSGTTTATPTPTGARSPISFFSRAAPPTPLTTGAAPAAPSSGAAHLGASGSLSISPNAPVAPPVPSPPGSVSGAAGIAPGAPLAPPVPPTPLSVSAAPTPTHGGRTAVSTPSHSGTVGALPSGYTIIGDGTPVVSTHHVRTASYDASNHAQLFSSSGEPLSPTSAANAAAGLPYLSASERAHRGTLRIRDPPPGSAAAAAAAGNAGAAGAAQPSTVQHVRRTAHFTFDPETGTFSDVPPEWQEALSKAFGLPLALCASKAVEGYAARLPPVLVHLKNQLVINGGLNSVGIFRIAPGNDDAVALKAHLNVCGPCSGKAFPTCADFNVVANLIKVWFRDMPARLLDAISSTDEVTAAAAANTPEAAAAVVLRHFKEPQLSLLLWLLDLCVDVSANAAVNRMTAQNMAIVISPNLFRLADAGHAPAGMDPMQQIAICKKYAVFFQNLIHWRAVDESRPGGPVPSVAFGVGSAVNTGAHV